MKKIFFSLPVAALLCLLAFPSCLKGGLDDLESYDEAEILGFNFEYRWYVTEGTSEKLQVRTLTTSTSIENGEVHCVITVPATTNAFTQAVKSQVSLSNITGYCTISTAAKIEPVGKAPVLGTIGDFTQSEMRYKVTAADGKTVKEWKLVIDGFTNN